MDVPPSDQPRAIVAALDAQAERIETPCGEGRMVWRRWGAGPPLVLLHGGHGSWTHWIRNIPFFAQRYRVAVPDMPGYGESALPPDPHDPASLAQALAFGLDDVFPGREPVALAGFSFGGVIAGHLARLRPDRAGRLVLVGAGGLGLERPTLPPLKRWRRLEGQTEREEAHRANLQILMLHDPARIDALALYLQSENTARAHIDSPSISATDTLRRCLDEVNAPLGGIWGEADATTGPFLHTRRELLRAIDPQSEFAVIPQAGHWVQYEAPEAFNTALEGVLNSLRRRDRQNAG
jgi:pimeloyl-ACP methyl ester carboxylesterase